MKKDKEKRIMKENQREISIAYEMLDTFNAEYKDEYHKIMKIAPIYRLPVRCPLLKEDEYEKVKLAYKELRKEFIAKIKGKVSLSYNLNGFIGRLKAREQIFVDDYWNMPMFYEKDGKWHFGPEKTLEQFLKEDLSKSPNLLIDAKNPSVFKGNEYGGNFFDLGDPKTDILLNRAGFGNRFYDRNKFIEGILAKKQGKQEIIHFIKKRLIPTCVFYSHLERFFKSFDLNSYQYGNLIELFKTSIKLLGIRPIHYKSEDAKGNDYFWYEDYAIFPNISINLPGEDQKSYEYHLPLLLFFDDEPEKRTEVFTFQKNNESISYEDNKLTGSNDGLLWRYIFLKQSGLVRNAKFMADTDCALFFNELYEQVRPRIDTDGSGLFGPLRQLFYPIFQIKEDGTFTVVTQESVPSICFSYDKIKIIEKETALKKAGHIPSELEEIFELAKV